jgi:hypothetical protein
VFYFFRMERPEEIPNVSVAICVFVLQYGLVFALLSSRTYVLLPTILMLLTVIALATVMRLGLKAHSKAGSRTVLAAVFTLRRTYSDEQREEFGRLVGDTIGRIESAQFLPHSGIRFPQNPCSTCPYVGLCLGKQEIVDAALVRRPGADSLDWLDELDY